MQPAPNTQQPNPPHGSDLGSASRPTPDDPPEGPTPAPSASRPRIRSRTPRHLGLAFMAALSVALASSRAIAIWVVAGITLTAGFAGCLAPDETVGPASADRNLRAADDGLITLDGRDLRVDLEARDEVPAPTWEVGDWFGVHVFFGSDDTTGEHIDTVVVETTPDTYTLATNNIDLARIHAVVNIPILGAVQADALQLDGLGGDWDVIQFPLSHGATWSGTIPNIAWDAIELDQVPLQLNATYQDQVQTTGGTFPGYFIVGTYEDYTLVEFTYVPAIEWFGEFLVYDIDEGDNPVEFRAISMGFGDNWSGTYYMAESSFQVSSFQGHAPDPGSPTDSMFAPEPHGSFEAGDHEDTIFGFMFQFVVLGIQSITFVSPSGQAYRYDVPSSDLDGAAAFQQLAIPSEAGTWRYFIIGPAPVSLSYIELYTLDEESKGMNNGEVVAS